MKSAAEMKVCSKCGPPAQPIENFAIRSRAREARQAMGKTCQRKYGKVHYQIHRAAYLKKARLHNLEQNRINAEFLVDYLRQHACMDCGESDIVVLEFDRLRDKVMDVSVLAREGYSLTRLKQEVAKCEVVCANCHRRRTAKQFGSYRLLSF